MVSKASPAGLSKGNPISSPRGDFKDNCANFAMA